MRNIYLALSIIGLIMPMICFGVHFTSRGDNAWSEFFAAPFATWVISGFSWDLMITATTITLWMQREAKRLKMPGFYWHFGGYMFCFANFSLPQRKTASPVLTTRSENCRIGVRFL
jgi:hypothetical protein